MSDLAPELRDAIKRHLRDMSCRDGTLSREGMIIRDMDEGLTVPEIAARQGTSVRNAGDHKRGTEKMLRGELPKSRTERSRPRPVTAICWRATCRPSCAAM